MNTTYKGKGQMERAFNEIRRQKMMPRCVKCGEETPWAMMSKENKRMCKDCWDIYDMDRFRVSVAEGTIEPKKEDKE